MVVYAINNIHYNNTYYFAGKYSVLKMWNKYSNIYIIFILYYVSVFMTIYKNLSIIIRCFPLFTNNYITILLNILSMVIFY